VFFIGYCAFSLFPEAQRPSPQKQSAPHFKQNAPNSNFKDENMQFKKLEVWQNSARLSADIYKSLVDLRDRGFKDQITRSGLSIPSNIAEGEERDSVRDTIRFLNFSKGSAGELMTQIYIGIDIGYISKETGKDWLERITIISKQLGALIKSKKMKL
jgi:four helix bundle protein